MRDPRQFMQAAGRLGRLLVAPQAIPAAVRCKREKFGACRSKCIVVMTEAAIRHLKVRKRNLAPPAGFEPATYCLEGIRSFLDRNQGDSYLVGDCLRQQADAQQSHRLEQLLVWRVNTQCRLRANCIARRALSTTTRRTSAGKIAGSPQRALLSFPTNVEMKSFQD
jgi:hypothetical protein